MKHHMRWGVEYRQNDGGMTGLIIFTAEDLRAANAYVDMMGAQYGFTDVSNLQQIANGASVAELRRLFPGYLPAKRGKQQCRDHHDVDG
jgi:hypothetical protein